MAFDQNTRNRLQRFVNDVRSLLVDEFTRQLQQVYGLDPKTGEAADLSKLSHLDDSHLETARVLREIRAHYLASEMAGSGKKIQKYVLDRIVREQAFTVLNRLAALRMMEARGLLRESIANGYQSQGFQLYERLGGHALGETGDAYRCYVFSLFDEFALDLKVLFDRHTPQGMLFPEESALLQLLDLLNEGDIEALWGEDETIGWLYQYFNSREERKKMREESAAPRNSRELAVRNQFFTPRYVVEFLTDNTLGRIWYEMTCGQTHLAEQCQYLVRRPTEIFLAEGEAAPETPDQEGLSQEELLQQPVHIPHRPLKDPREIRLLDPACGSMHFGLYAFDLFEIIYEEAWDNGSCPTLHEAYPFKNDFLKDVPRLIIEHNIHGIDIDPRAVQIAGLSLWLRAQKAWQAQGVQPADRPRVRRSNIVCAEPMLGSPEMLEDFVATLDPPLLGELVKTVFDKMQLAGEAGSLLKIEEEIRAAIDTVRKEWLKQQDDLLTRKDGSQEEFFETAEQQVIDALRAYAEQADADSYQRRLFADDAARGFAFIDLCRKRYDAVVMNPPFGLFVTATLAYAKSLYADSSNDIYAAFVDRAVRLSEAQGVVGAISSRLGFYLDGLTKWRLRLMGETGALRLVADLGYGVLDALVETAAYVIDKNTNNPSICAISALSTEEKGEVLFRSIEKIASGGACSTLHLSNLASLRVLPGSVLAYWLSSKFLKTIAMMEAVESASISVYSGLQTDDDFRFLRLWWECSSKDIDRIWFPFAKGGEYQPFADDLHLVANWREQGREMKEFVAIKYVNWSRHIKNTEQYFRSGLTYSERTTSDISVRALPPGAIFSVSGPVLQSNDETQLMMAWALFNTRAGRSLVEMAVGSGDTSKSGTAARHYRTGILAATPLPWFNDANSSAIQDCLRSLFRENMRLRLASETHRHFSSELRAQIDLASWANARWIEVIDGFLRASASSFQMETIFNEAFSLSQDEVSFLAGTHPCEHREIPEHATLRRAIEAAAESESALCALAARERVHSRVATKKTYYFSRELELVSAIAHSSPESLRSELSHASALSQRLEGDLAGDLFSRGIGFSFGRWDVRYATGERQPPELPDPFDPLPVCPPGMLQNAEGLPAGPKDVPAEYPLRISWPGILVDDENHPEDIVARVRKAIEVIWPGSAGSGSRAEAIEQEACEILGVRTMRDYFRRPAAFFADHLKRYSKSRRKAPIYWPISTKSGSYTLWLYYHRLNDQTLYICVNDFVEPKLQQVTVNLESLRNKSDRTSKDEKDLSMFFDLKAEFEEYRDELLRVAKFWKPDLNDGVQITAAPLWPLFRHKPWQKLLKDTWKKLEKGDYDWAHLAMNYWPDRVREKCRTDKSLAIAHGLEELYEKPPEQPKKARGRKNA